MTEADIVEILEGLDRDADLTVGYFVPARHQQVSNLLGNGPDQHRCLDCRCRICAAEGADRPISLEYAISGTLDCDYCGTPLWSPCIECDQLGTHAPDCSERDR